MQNNNGKFDETISSDEILRLILEEHISIWDLSILINVNLSAANLLKELLIKCCNKDMADVNKYINIIKANNKYIKEEYSKKDEFNFKTLSYLAKAGFTKVEILKKFGISESAFSYYIKKCFKNEKITNSRKNDLLARIKSNRSSKKVEITYPDTTYQDIEEEKDTLDLVKEDTSNEQIEIKDDNVDTIPIEVTFSTEKINTNKIILYTYEYLKYSDLKDDFLDFNAENIILTCTFDLFMKDKEIMHAKKSKVASFINNSNINLRILATSSNYKLVVSQKDNYIATDNDIVLSQALMLSRYTEKDIYVATVDQKTALNLIFLEFGIRTLKKYVLEQYLCNFEEEDNLSYFDYKIPKEDCSDYISKFSNVYVLDTCFIISNTSDVSQSYKEKARKIVFESKDELKIVVRDVLEELKMRNQFFSLLYASKHNPSIKLDLNTKMNYNYNDLAILNLAMYYENYNKHVTLFTHDFTLFKEALQYNIKTLFLQEDFEGTMELEEENISYNSSEQEYETEGGDEDKEDSKEDSNVRYKTIAFGKYGENRMLLNSNTIAKVIDHSNMTEIQLKGHGSFKYYPVNIGDYIIFNKDDTTYRIDSFSKKTNNLSSVNIIL